MHPSKILEIDQGALLARIQLKVLREMIIINNSSSVKLYISKIYNGLSVPANGCGEGIVKQQAKIEKKAQGKHIKL